MRKRKNSQQIISRRISAPLRFCAGIFFSCSILLLAMCSDLIKFDPFDPYVKGAANGQGYLLLDIEGRNGRTIKPSIDFFTDFTLDFYDGTFTESEIEDETPVQIINLDDSEIADPIYLNAGTYTLFIKAYLNTDLGATGFLSGIEIDEDTATLGTVTLRAVTPTAGGKGIFSWEIKFGEDDDVLLLEASIEISQIGGTFNETYYIEHPTITADIDKSDEIELDVGEYDVTFYLLKDTDCRDVFWQETLHIYQNMVSHFAHTFSTAFINNEISSYLITFKDGYDGDTIDSYSVLHGGTITEPADPVRSGYTFTDWYDGANVWDFSTLVDRAITLTAGWEEIISITIDTQPEEETTVIEGSITGDLSVTASVTGGGTLSYQWYENDTDSNVGGTEIDGETDSSFTIPDDLTEGTYYYFCEVSAASATSVRSDVATVIVTVTSAPTGDGEFTFDIPLFVTNPVVTSPLVLSRSTEPKGTLSISNIDAYPEFTYFEWWHDGSWLHSGETLELDLDEVPEWTSYNIIGTQSITVYAREPPYGGPFYSVIVKFEVVP